MHKEYSNLKRNFFFLFPYSFSFSLGAEKEKRVVVVWDLPSHLAGGGGGSSSSGGGDKKTTKPTEGGSGKYPELEKKIKDTLAFSWDTPSNKKILVSQQDYTAASTFSISGNFLTDLNKFANQKKQVQFGYKVAIGEKATEEKKVDFVPNQKKFDLTIDNFYSLRPNSAFAKPRATVTLYIDNEKVYFKEFDGAIVRGAQDPKIFFKDSSGSEITDERVILSNVPKTLVISGEKFDGLENRIEANKLILNSTVTINSVPSITNPNKSQGVLEIFNSTLTVSKTSGMLQQTIVRSKLFSRPKDSKEDWLETATTTRYYSLSKPSNEETWSIKYSPYVFSTGEDFSITFSFSTTAFTNPIRTILFSSYNNRTGFYEMISGVMGVNGKILSTTSDGLSTENINFRNRIITSFTFEGKNTGEVGSLSYNQPYTLILKGFKRKDGQTFKIIFTEATTLLSREKIIDLFIK